MRGGRPSFACRSSGMVVRLMNAGLIMSVSLSGSGCSALRSRPPRVLPLQSPEECSGSKGPPIADVILAAVSGGGAVIGLGGAALVSSAASNQRVPSWDPHSKADSSEGTLLLFGLAATAATAGFVASAYHGFNSASACRAAVRDLRLRYPPLPYYLPPPAWWPPAPPQAAPSPVPAAAPPVLLLPPAVPPAAPAQQPSW
jgi:hypothetical protein